MATSLFLPTYLGTNCYDFDIQNQRLARQRVIGIETDFLIIDRTNPDIQFLSGTRHRQLIAFFDAVQQGQPRRVLLQAWVAITKRLIGRNDHVLPLANFQSHDRQVQPFDVIGAADCEFKRLTMFRRLNIVALFGSSLVV
ncbi:MAG: hypothetical protein JWN70_1608, partial [Planctomycetaceae bacterium]|nr:hypothetical protein [Planctomycetaceae bacterium]